MQVSPLIDRQFMREEEKLGYHVNDIDTGSELDANKRHSSLLSPGSVGVALHHSSNEKMDGTF